MNNLMIPIIIKERNNGMITKTERTSKIECEFQCGCWFDFDSSEQVTQSCMYHNKRLLMRSDVKSHFAEKSKPEIKSANYKK